MLEGGSGKQKILVVDDTPANLMILGEDLQESYEVFVATDGEAALKKVTANPPDLVLLDIVMPGLDGYEVCRRMKEDPVSTGIPVIFITAKNTVEDEARGLEIGAVDYITKPFNMAIVRARVRTHLELKRKSDILESLSRRDGLTGIFNRRQFDEVLAQEWRRAARNGRPLSVIILDIDCFKLYNDNYGHLSGDQCLRRIALALSSTLQRATDLVARYGGEEFVVILGETQAKAALKVGNRILLSVEALRIEHAYSTVAPHVTVSVGVATTFPEAGTDERILLEVADNALYEAKVSGRNRVRHRYL